MMNKYLPGNSPAHGHVIRHKDECPSFNFTQKKLDILLPNGVTKEIALPVQNLAFGNVLYGCLVSIEGIDTYVSARIFAGNVICSAMKFSYENDNATAIATVTVVWNKVNFIDRINGKCKKK